MMLKLPSSSSLEGPLSGQCPAHEVVYKLSVSTGKKGRYLSSNKTLTCKSMFFQQKLQTCADAVAVDGSSHQSADPSIGFLTAKFVASAARKFA